MRPGADACTDADADVISHACPDRVGGADARTKSLADAGAYVVTELCAESSAEFRTIAVSYVFAELSSDVGPELRADAVAYVFADPRADGAPELRADESPDLRADELADGSSVARAVDAADVGAVACAHDGAHAEAVARADPVVDADHDADHGADEGPDDHPDDRADVAAVGSAVARAVEGPDGRSDGAGPDTCADEGPDERADGSTHPRAVAEADQHALPDAAAVARAEHTSADARALGVPDRGVGRRRSGRALLPRRRRERCVHGLPGRRRGLLRVARRVRVPRFRREARV